MLPRRILGLFGLCVPLCVCGGEEPPSSSDGSGLTDSSSGGGIDIDEEKLDLGGGATAGNGGDCPGGGGGNSDDYEFSIIWVANTTEGTVSKIDTQSATELARYQAGPGGDPDPSRTSVNLIGDVAIANRSGSVTKIASNIERCTDSNGNGTIDTSQGPADILPWGEDECVRWHHDIDFDDSYDNHQGGPRAIAWEAGDTEAGCQADARLWVGWRNQPNETAIIRRLDGATGAVLDEVTIENWEGNWGHGTYGGASDREGAFWVLGTLGTLVKIDPVTVEQTRWDNPESHVMYGIALDVNGDPWLAGYDGNLWWFDRETETFNDMGAPSGPSRMRGLAIDSNGQAWIAGNNDCALARFDTLTQSWVDENIDLPGCQEPVGVSIDVDGMVWVVDRDANQAYKVDPNDYTNLQTVTGLVAPYTYSDMTGAGLGLVTSNPQG